MGILNTGIFGGFRKKTGPLIGRRSRNQNVITGLHHKSNKPTTEKQLVAQHKFALLNSFLSGITELLNLGFKKHTKNNSTANAAYTYNYPHAFLPQEESWVLNYPALVYSRGHVAGPQGVEITLVQNPDMRHEVVFKWALQAQSEYCQFTDRASFLVYSPTKQRAVTVADAVDRYAMEYRFPLPADIDGTDLHCYMSFRSANGKQAGNSRYLGVIPGDNNP